MRAFGRWMLRCGLFLLIAAAGVTLKLYHLDHKLLWIDEVFTIQHTSGIPDREYPGLIPLNEIGSADSFCDVYRLNTRHQTLGGQLRGLSAAPQLNPLHYPLLMIWYRLVGDAPVHYRLFSAVMFVMTLPFLFLLARTLFGSHLAGWIAVSLYAVSPFLHLFAQEARYYTLWAFVLVVLHWLVVEACHRNTRGWWSSYAAAAAASLYASPVSIFILLGHGVFVYLRRRDVFLPAGLALLVAFLAYLPWTLALLGRMDAITHGLSWQANSRGYSSFWTVLFGQTLFLVSIFAFKLDYLAMFGQSSITPPPDAMTGLLFDVVALALVCAAFVFMVVKSRKDVRDFLLLAVMPGLLFFFATDLARGSMMSWWWRYLIFAAPGVILVMTNLLHEGIEKGRVLPVVAWATLAVMGISSIATIANARHWHIGTSMDIAMATARHISHAKKALLITDVPDNRSMVDLFILLRECDGVNIDIMRTSPGVDSIANRIPWREYSDVYVAYASDALVENLQSQCGRTMERVPAKGISPLWRIGRAEREQTGGDR